MDKRVFYLTLLVITLFVGFNSMKKNPDIQQDDSHEQYRTDKENIHYKIFRGEKTIKEYALTDTMKFSRYIHKGITWIKQDDWENTVFHFGLPEFGLPLVSKDPGPLPIEGDLITYLITKMKVPKIKYLEIGVSVGKTVYQISRFLEYNKDNVAVAFDLEVINPTFEKLMTKKDVLDTWKFNDPSFTPKKDYSITQYTTKGGNDFYYCNSNEFDASGWKRLKDLGFKFNVIFSDARHDYEALRFEWQQVKENDLLTLDEFYYFYDDLQDESSNGEGSMNRAFWQNCDEIKAEDPRIKCKIIKINGWFGVHEFMHHFGIITNINIDEVQKAYEKPLI